MRCFVLLVALSDGVHVPVMVNRDLITTISPVVSRDCNGGKSHILFNGSLPGRCVVETPDEIMRKPCVVGRGGD
ncbi:hypothetical protein [Methylobacterium thuringiense]|uniref:Secreted protein n=1 Tax=Methylobacterium thuringiense TaxID=1003091 RepID=A0ABQ4TL12_9HYPH|nr:hypothetical protein [Methylobacterium thuringiense]GJE55257.1 hypothetical protein EKPJFOCH_1746 [Methylobacterium thuringiense]